MPLIKQPLWWDEQSCGGSWTPLRAGGSALKLSTSRVPVKTGIPQKTWWKGQNSICCHNRWQHWTNLELVFCSIMKMGLLWDSEASGISEGWVLWQDAWGQDTQISLQEAMKGDKEAGRTHYNQEVEENQGIWDSFAQILHVTSLVKHKKKARWFGGMSK